MFNTKSRIITLIFQLSTWAINFNYRNVHPILYWKRPPNLGNSLGNCESWFSYRLYTVKFNTSWCFIDSNESLSLGDKEISQSR